MGLTEFQVFDARGRWIILRSDALSVEGAEKTSGPLGVLVNRHHKTTKERNMWTTRFDKSNPCPRIVVTLDARLARRGVSRLAIWNFNGDNLDKGVKHLRIYYQDKVAFEGVLEQGSGNQILDYVNNVPVTISANDSPEPPEDENSRSATRNMGYVEEEASGRVKRPVVEETQVEQKTREKLLQIVEEITDLDAEVDSSSHSLFPASKEKTEGVETVTNAEEEIDESKNKSPKTKDRKSISPSKTSPKSRGSVVKPGKLKPKKRVPAGSGGKKFKKAKNWTFGFNMMMSEDSTGTEEDLGIHPKKWDDGREDLGIHPKKWDDGREEDKEESLLDQLRSANLKEEDAARPSENGDFRSILKPSEPLLESDEESRMIKSWLKEDERLPFHFDEDDDKTKSEKKPRPKSGRRAGDGSAQNVAGVTLRSPDELPVPSGTESSRDFLLVEEVERIDSVSTISLRSPSGLRPSSSEMSITGRQILPSTESVENKGFDPLESSWNSLNAFHQLHRGQISMEIEGDVLDMMMFERGKEPFVAKRASSVPPTEPVVEDKSVPPGSSSPSNLTHSKFGAEEEDEEFLIPELPVGSFLQINVRSTWGDPHYVGLNGIEIFSSSGDLVEIADVSADPPDINILSEYNRDPRIVANLFDGVNRTTDDLHMWLCPFTPGEDHIISVELGRQEEIAMIRFWNYNKSRTYALRGARDVEISLDSELIFKGEIAKAQGGVLGGTEAFGDTILFTTDEWILERVAENDDSFEGSLLEPLVDDRGPGPPTPRPPSPGPTGQRPFTCARDGKLRRGGIESGDAEH